MVGSVLMQRMVEERDFDAIRPVFSTSQLGQPAPSFGGSTGGTLQDAFDLDALKALDIIVTCRRRLHQRDLPEAARKRLAGLLD
ncbi:Aspartate-semialdehyde dehydrogenase [Klebsiella pneumoniae]|nr:Aspartate-semialdehyde dehydrogenase [Klebsiella pneumoniae]